MIAHPRDPVDFGAEACAIAEKYLKATDTGGLAYWRSPHGERFFQANIAAIQRGVKIIRVFMQPINELKENIDVLEKHRSAGVEVYVAQPQEIPLELAEDYLIIDDRVFSVMTFSSDGQPREERISIDEVEAQRLAKKFDAVRQRSKALEIAIRDLK